MPGMPFLTPSDPFVQNQPQAAATPAGAVGSNTTFIIWLIVIGVVIPGIILGSLRAGGYQFVFRRR